MSWLVLTVIFLCLKCSFAYVFPLSVEVSGCLFNFFQSSEPIEPSYIEQFLIWTGVKERPKMDEMGNGFFCGGFLMTILATVLILYLTFLKNYERRREKNAYPLFIPFLEENGDQEEDPEEEEDSYESSKTCSRCTCNECMNEAGDMKFPESTQNDDNVDVQFSEE